MIFRIAAVFAAHYRTNRQIHPGSAILPLVAPAIEVGVALIVRVEAFKDMPRHTVAESIAVAAGQIRIAAVIAYAGNIETGIIYKPVFKK